MGQADFIPHIYHSSFKLIQCLIFEKSIENVQEYQIFLGHAVELPIALIALRIIPKMRFFFSLRKYFGAMWVFLKQCCSTLIAEL